MLSVFNISAILKTPPQFKVFDVKSLQVILLQLISVELVIIFNPILVSNSPIFPSTLTQF